VRTLESLPLASLSIHMSSCRREVSAALDQPALCGEIRMSKTEKLTNRRKLWSIHQFQTHVYLFVAVGLVFHRKLLPGRTI